MLLFRMPNKKILHPPKIFDKIGNGLQEVSSFLQHSPSLPDPTVF